MMPRQAITLIFSKYYDDLASLPEEVRILFIIEQHKEQIRKISSKLPYAEKVVEISHRNFMRAAAKLEAAKENKDKLKIASATVEHEQRDAELDRATNRLDKMHLDIEQLRNEISMLQQHLLEVSDGIEAESLQSQNLSRSTPVRHDSQSQVANSVYMHELKGFDLTKLRRAKIMR